jgi:hypothetical protein
MPRLVCTLTKKTVDTSKVFNGTVYGMIECLKLLDEDSDHDRAKLRALFSVAANFPIKAFEVNPFARFH